MSTAYEVLNVATTANDAEIKQAYLRLVKDNPPDRNQEKFQLIHDLTSILIPSLSAALTIISAENRSGSCIIARFVQVVKVTALVLRS
jgi:hypothetical protein